MAHLIDKDALVAEIERRIGEIDKYYCDINCVYQRIEECKGSLSFLDALEVKEVDSLQEEPASEDLEEASKNYALNNTPWDDCKDEIQESFKAGAKWQKEKDESTTEDLGEYINELSKQFQEVSFAKLSRIAVRVSRWQQNQDVKNKLPKVTDRTELDEYAYQTAYDLSNDWAKEDPTWHDVEMACKLGAKWQKEHLWKPTNGDDLPEYDREVIAILDYDFGHYKVVYAHRPNPNGWNGTNIDTEEKEHFEPVIYDKGWWNQPHVLYWLDTRLPYEESEIDKEIEL